MGDVIHCLPAVTDLHCNHPQWTIDWVVEEGFADIPRLHPAVDRIIPVAIRRWRKHPFDRLVRQQFGQFRQKLRQRHYDLVIDAQGLIKSAWIGRLVDTTVTCGYDRNSIREPLASWFYQRRFAVGRELHAVERNRLLVAKALNYLPESPVNYGLQILPAHFDWLPASAYVVALHATSRSDKEWPEAAWIEIGLRLAQQGLALILPWGSTSERERAQRLARSLRTAVVAPRLDLASAASLLAGAKLVIGVDTGLTHLAAAVAVPVIALYCASDPGLTGVLGSAFHVNLGSNGNPPDIETTWRQVQRMLNQ